METKGRPKLTKRRNPRHYMREWRQERDMTQLALAKAIGFDKKPDFPLRSWHGRHEFGPHLPVH